MMSSFEKEIKQLVNKHNIICLEGTSCVGKNYLYHNIIKKVAKRGASFYKPFRSSWEGHKSPHGRAARHMLDLDLSQAKNISLDFYAQLIIDNNIPPKIIIMDRGFLSTWAYTRYKRKYLYPPTSETKYFDKRLKNFYELIYKYNGMILLLIADKDTLLKHRAQRIKKGELVPPILQMLVFQKNLINIVKEFDLNKVLIYQADQDGRYKKIILNKAEKIVDYSLPKRKNMTKVKIYLAGPFFNDEQRDLIRKMESFLEKEGFIVFSPSRDSIVVKPNDKQDNRKKAFLWNCKRIKEANIILAILDYAGSDLYTKSPIGEKVKVNIPDTGTIWEIGYAFAYDKPIMGFSKNIDKINLMLALGIDCIANDLNNLSRILEELKVHVIDKNYGFSKYDKKARKRLREKYGYKSLIE